MPAPIVAVMGDGRSRRSWRAGRVLCYRVHHTGSREALRIGAEARTVCNATTSRAPSVSTTRTNMLIKNPRITPPSCLVERQNHSVDAREREEDSEIVRFFCESPARAAASQGWRMMTMAKRILVPMDAREDSEAIVPVVAAMAQSSGASVRLVRVSAVPERVVGPYGRTIAYSDQEMARVTAEGLDDLHRIEAELHGIPVESVVRFGDPVAEILLEADVFDAD